MGRESIRSDYKESKYNKNKYTESDISAFQEPYSNYFKILALHSLIYSLYFVNTYKKQSCMLDILSIVILNIYNYILCIIMYI